MSETHMSETRPQQPRIAIFGAGSIGCYLGGCLQAGGTPVTLIGRARTQQQLASHGMRLTDWQGRDVRVKAQDIDYALSASAMAAANYVLLTVKSGDTEAAAKSIAEHAPADAVIVSFQNGVRNVDVLQQLLPQHKVLKGMVSFNVISSEEGHLHCGTEGNLAIQSQPGRHGDLLQALHSAGLPVTVYSDLAAVQWSKLVMNLSNAVNALSGVPVLEQLNDATYRKVTAVCIKETLGILNAAGIKLARTGKVIPAALPHVLALPDWLFKLVAGSMMKIDPQARSSMYQDLALGRKTEVDYLNGEIVRLAESQGRKAPINAAIVQLVKDAEQRATGSPMISAAVLLEKITKASGLDAG